MNLDLVKQQLEKLNAKSPSTIDFKSIFTEIPYGTTTIRILPYKYNLDWPFIEQYVYYLNKTQLISNKTFGVDDPISTFVKSLYATKNETDKILANSLRPTKRYLAPCIKRDNYVQGETTTTFVSLSETNFKEILKNIYDPECGDVTNAKTGYDIIIEKLSPAQAGNKYGKTSIRIARKSSKLAETDEEIQRIIDSTINIQETPLFKKQPDEKYNEVLQKYLDYKDDKLEEGKLNSTSLTLNQETVKSNEALTERFKNLLKG